MAFNKIVKLLQLLSIQMVFASPIHAGGKKSETIVDPAELSPPLRIVYVRPVDSTPFQLPNGSTVDLSADLDSMVMTELVKTGWFAPAPFEELPANSEPSCTKDCNSHLELRAAVTTLELNTLELGIRFGYTPTEEIIPGLTSLTGSVATKIGTLSMDFQLYRCNDDGCHALLASTANHFTAKLDLKLEIDFGDIHTGPGLIWNSSLGGALRKTMKKGLTELTDSKYANSLPWQSNIRLIDWNTGTVVLDKGTQDQLSLGQDLIIYSQLSPDDNACQPYRAIAKVTVIETNPISSTAIISEQIAPEEIRIGDLALINPAIRGQ